MFDPQQKKQHGLTEKINLSSLIDVELLWHALLRYLSTKDLILLRRAASSFHPYIQTFWYRFDDRQQMYYLMQYALEIREKKYHPFRLEQIKQALRDGVLLRHKASPEISRTVAWLLGSLLQETGDCWLPTIKSPFLSAVLNLFHHQGRGNDTLCQRSYYRALEHIGEMSKIMEPLLKVLVLSVFYRPGDFLNSFRQQLKKKGESVFWQLDVVVANCGKARLPGVLKAWLPCFQGGNGNVHMREAVVPAWVAIQKHHPHYSKKAWAKPLHLYLKTFHGFYERINILVELLKQSNKHQFMNLIKKLFFQFKVRFTDMRLAAIQGWIEIAKCGPEHECPGLAAPLLLLFTAKDQHVRQSVVQASPEITTICNKPQRLHLLIALCCCFRDSSSAIRCAAIRAWIDIHGHVNHQCQDWTTPLYRLFEDKYYFVRSSIVHSSPEIAAYCDKVQFAGLLQSLLFCLADMHFLWRSTWFYTALEPHAKFIWPLSEIAKYCDGDQFRLLLERAFVVFEKWDVCEEDVIAFGALAKYCHKKQLTRLIAVLRLYVHTHLSGYGYKQRAVLLASSEISKHCNKHQFVSLVDWLLPQREDTNKNVSQGTARILVDLLSSAHKRYLVHWIKRLLLLLFTEEIDISRGAAQILIGLAKYCEAGQFYAWLETLSLLLALGGHDNRHKEAVRILFRITPYCHPHDFSLIINLLFPLMKRRDWGIGARDIRFTAKIARRCDDRQFSQLMRALRPWMLRPMDTAGQAAIQSLGQIIRECSSKHRRDILNFFIEDDVIDRSVILIIKEIVLLDCLAPIKIDKSLYRRLIQLNIIHKKQTFKQEQQDDFRAAIGDLKKKRSNTEMKQAVAVLYNDLLSRSSVLAVIDNRETLAISFFFLKLEALLKFSSFTALPRERKKGKKKALDCARFFCCHHPVSTIKRVVAMLPHQGFFCPRPVGVLLNRHLQQVAVKYN